MMKNVIDTSVLFGFMFIFSCGTGSNYHKGKDDEPIRSDKSWSVIGIGGGGAMFNQSVSPHDPDFAFVSCDMGGTYLTYNGGQTWRMFNFPTNTKFYVFDPLDENTVYANSLGLFKSTDKGHTWNLIYPDPKQLVGLISKGDHASYHYVTRDSTHHKVLALAIDPEISTDLYAAITIDKTTALYISNDGGDHWNLERKLDPEIENIFIDPSSDKENRTIYVAGKKGMMTRLNGRWNNTGLPKGVGSITTFTGGYDELSQQFVIYAISGTSYFNMQEEKSGIFFTADGGRHWENRQDGILTYSIAGSELQEWRTIATSSFHPNVVYVSYANLQVGEDTTSIGVAKSSDYGKTWELVWKDLITDSQQIASPNFSRDWLNERMGPSWGENPFSIGVSPTNPDICFTGDFGRTIKTSNGGISWQQVYSIHIKDDYWASRGLDVTTAYTITFDPFDSSHVFIPTTDIGLMESHDGTNSWRSATKDNGVPSAWLNTCYWLAFDPKVKGKAWAVMSNTHDLPRPKMFRRNGVKNYKGGILITEDGGKNWIPVSNDIGEAAMTHILLDPASPIDSRILYACAFGKGVYKSTDGGHTWIQKNKGIAGEEPFAWQISRRDQDGALYLVISRRSEDGSIHNDQDGALYKSVDGADSWSRIPLPKGTNAPTSIAFGNDPQQIILSAWGRLAEGQFSPDIGGGIFLSDDDGKTWRPVLAEDQHIGAVTFDDRSNRFYACGFNSSAYFSEDNASSWERIRGYDFKWGQRVEPDPLDPEKIFVITFGGGVWHGPAKGTPDRVEEVIIPGIAYP